MRLTRTRAANSTFIISVLLNVALVLSPILLWISGYYDAFYPTSSYSLLKEEQLLSKSLVVKHAKLYNDHYPFSIYLINIMSEVASFNFFHVGYVPVTFFSNYLFFSMLLNATLSPSSKYDLSHKWYYVLKSMYILSLLNWAYGYTPVFYITLGSTAMVIAIHLLMTSMMKRDVVLSLKTPEFIVILLLIIVCIFSYYTSGTIIMLTLTAFLIMKIILVFVNRSKMIESRTALLITTIVILYFTFDEIFYRRVRDLGLSFDDIMIHFLERHTVTSEFEYQFSLPLFSLIQRAILYTLLLLTIPIPILFIYCILTRSKRIHDNIQDTITLLFTLVLVLGFQSSIYSFLMGKFFLLTRYFFIAPYMTFILLYKIFPSKTVTKLYMALIITWSLLSFISFSYQFTDIRVLSARTSYVSFNELPALCQFYSHSDISLDVFSDLKTAFTLPYACGHSYLRFLSFELSMFQLYDDSLNILTQTRPGIYMYTTIYSQTGVIMLEWFCAKPFIVIERYIDKIYDGGTIKLYYS